MGSISSQPSQLPSSASQGGNQPTDNRSLSEKFNKIQGNLKNPGALHNRQEIEQVLTDLCQTLYQNAVPVSPAQLKQITDIIGQVSQLKKGETDQPGHQPDRPIELDVIREDDINPQVEQDSGAGVGNIASDETINDGAAMLSDSIVEDSGAESGNIASDETINEGTTILPDSIVEDSPAPDAALQQVSQPKNQMAIKESLQWLVHFRDVTDEAAKAQVRLDKENYKYSKASLASLLGTAAIGETAHVSTRGVQAQVAADERDRAMNVDKKGLDDDEAYWEKKIKEDPDNADFYGHQLKRTRLAKGRREALDEKAKGDLDADEYAAYEEQMANEPGFMENRKSDKMRALSPAKQRKVNDFMKKNDAEQVGAQYRTRETINKRQRDALENRKVDNMGDGGIFNEGASNPNLLTREDQIIGSYPFSDGLSQGKYNDVDPETATEASLESRKLETENLEGLSNEMTGKIESRRTDIDERKAALEQDKDRMTQSEYDRRQQAIEKDEKTLSNMEKDRNQLNDVVEKRKSYNETIDKMKEDKDDPQKLKKHNETLKQQHQDHEKSVLMYGETTESIKPDEFHNSKLEYNKKNENTPDSYKQVDQKKIDNVRVSKKQIYDSTFQNYFKDFKDIQEFGTMMTQTMEGAVGGAVLLTIFSKLVQTGSMKIDVSKLKETLQDLESDKISYDYALCAALGRRIGNEEGGLEIHENYVDSKVAKNKFETYKASKQATLNHLSIDGGRLTLDRPVVTKSLRKLLTGNNNYRSTLVDLANAHVKKDRKLTDIEGPKLFLKQLANDIDNNRSLDADQKAFINALKGRLAGPIAQVVTDISINDDGKLVIDKDRAEHYIQDLRAGEEEQEICRASIPDDSLKIFQEKGLLLTREKGDLTYRLFNQNFRFDPNNAGQPDNWIPKADLKPKENLFVSLSNYDVQHLIVNERPEEPSKGEKKAQLFFEKIGTPLIFLNDFKGTDNKVFSAIQGFSKRDQADITSQAIDGVEDVSIEMVLGKPQITGDKEAIKKLEKSMSKKALKLARQHGFLPAEEKEASKFSKWVAKSVVPKVQNLKRKGQKVTSNVTPKTMINKTTAKSRSVAAKTTVVAASAAAAIGTGGASAAAQVAAGALGMAAMQLEAMIVLSAAFVAFKAGNDSLQYDLRNTKALLEQQLGDETQDILASLRKATGINLIDV